MAGDERNHIDDANLHVTGRHSEVPAPHVGIDQNDDGVVIVVTQAFGPKGDNLVGVSDVTFDGYPAVSVGVRLPDGKEGVVHLIAERLWPFRAGDLPSRSRDFH